MIKGYFLVSVLWALVHFLPTKVKGQTDNCLLIDSLNKEPVAYASISAGSFVAYANDQGIFSTTDLPNDTLRISRLGYRTMTILKSELTSTIVLSPTSYSIREIVVSGNAEAFELGYHNLPSFGFTYMKKLFMAVYIESSTRRSRIEKILVHTRRNRQGTEFVIALFSVTEKGLPGDLIFSKEYKSPTGKNMLEISVHEANLKMPEDGIFVAIKTKDNSADPEDSKDHGLLRLSKELEHCVSYFHAVNQWFKHDFKELDHRLNYKIGLELVPL